MNSLFLCLGSYKITDTTGNDADCFDRQLLYSVALTRLCELSGANNQIIVLDNTVASQKELHPHLQQALVLPEISDVLLLNNNSIGSKNKGAGEYEMCKFAFLKRPDLFAKADWVIYYTHRHTMPFPLVFEYLEKFQDFDAIVSSAEYLYPDGTRSVPGDGLFDDLIFAMK